MPSLPNKYGEIKKPDITGFPYLSMPLRFFIAFPTNFIDLFRYRVGFVIEWSSIGLSPYKTFTGFLEDFPVLDKILLAPNEILDVCIFFSFLPLFRAFIKTHKNTNCLF